MSEQIPTSANANGAAPLIKDTTTATFMEDVINASKECPVIIDFWAPNSAPCAQLTPALENAVKEAGGAVKLVKINLQENSQLAAQFQVQTVPTVFAMKNGQPVDAFAGVMPPNELKAFIKALTGDSNALNEALESADEKLRAGEAEAAAEIYASVLQQDPENAEAIGGLIKCYIEIGELETAKMTIESMTDELKNHSAIESAIKALELAEKAGDTGPLDELRAKRDAEPENYNILYELAIAESAHNNKEEAVSALMTILRKDLEWNDGAARAQLLEFFEAWGPKEPATISGRRNLASLLFA
ncbi:MAG: co-chaperone YbbN [Rhodomicrobium sp.]|nr:MAG: co-chaperone YbbN [Rhodomicrobium sp.]